MKRSGTTITFAIVCVAVLLASYGVGLGIREIRFRNVEAQTTVNKKEVPTNTLPQRQLTPAARSPEAGRPDATIFGEGGNRGGTQEEGMGRRGRRGGGNFENLTEEERAQMRERSGRRGRGGMDFENLSEEERAAMEEQRQQMRERFQNMTDEERAQFRGSRGGRGGRSRGGMSDFGAGGNDLGFEGNNSESDENDIQSEDNGSGTEENDAQSEDNDFGQEDVDNDIE